MSDSATEQWRKDSNEATAKLRERFPDFRCVRCGNDNFLMRVWRDSSLQPAFKDDRIAPFFVFDRIARSLEPSHFADSGDRRGASPKIDKKAV